MRSLAIVLLLPGLLCAERVTIERARPRRQPTAESSRPAEQPPSRGPVVIERRREAPPQQPQPQPSAPSAIEGDRRVTIERRDPSGPRRERRGPSHSSITRDPALMRELAQRRRVEIVPNRHYRHNWRGRPYWHYYDRHRHHWYGYYSGPYFHWTLYYGNHWWWYDPGYRRWAYWWDGGWWWPGPAGVVRVYAYDEPPRAAVAPSPQSGSWRSPDGSREVQVSGLDAEAFLYRRQGEELIYLRHLGKNVKDVRFSTVTADKPLRILLDLKDGGFAVFDADGIPLEAPSDAAQPPPSIPTPPEAIPPPPPVE